MQALLDGAVPLEDGALPRALAAERRDAEESLARWRATAPTLTVSLDVLRHTWSRSVNDIAALRMREADFDVGRLPAAGTPWFMTVFGRDTLITCLQTLLFGPELATSALRELAALQADEDDPERDAEPGKIIHELRRGKAARAWTDRYYGTVDATPLFLVLLSELWRWTGDRALARELEGRCAPRARAGSTGPATATATGSSSTCGERDAGSATRAGRTRTPSMVFRDGSLAEPPIASVEVQGYVYDAKLRIAELAREVWDDARRSPSGSSARRSSARALQRGVLGRRRRLLRARPRPRRSGRSTPSARTWATCCGAGSFRPSASTPSPSG